MWLHLRFCGVAGESGVGGEDKRSNVTVRQAWLLGFTTHAMGKNNTTPGGLQHHCWRVH